MFKQIIAKRPCSAMVNGITSSPQLGKPNYSLALKQHDSYIAALKSCGVEVTVLEADDAFPDSCFVEDTAVIMDGCAIITNPGDPTRCGEAGNMLPAVKKFFADDQIEFITDPGTLDGGDVMMVGNHFYIGRSARTNAEGIRQFIAILARHGFNGSSVHLEEVLHLKTGVNYLEHNNLLVAGEFIDKPEFASYNKIIVPADEAYAANCIWVNEKVIVPQGYPTVEKAVRDAGYEVLTVDTSEFRKLDGGLSCLSLRF